MSSYSIPKQNGFEFKVYNILSQLIYIVVVVCQNDKYCTMNCCTQKKLTSTKEKTLTCIVSENPNSGDIILYVANNKSKYFPRLENILNYSLSSGPGN